MRVGEGGIGLLTELTVDALRRLQRGEADHHARSWALQGPDCRARPCERDRPRPHVQLQIRRQRGDDGTCGGSHLCSPLKCYRCAAPTWRCRVVNALHPRTFAASLLRCVCTPEPRHWLSDAVAELIGATDLVTSLRPSTSNHIHLGLPGLRCAPFYSAVLVRAQRFLVDLIGVVMEGLPDHLIPGVPWHPRDSNPIPTQAAPQPAAPLPSSRAPATGVGRTRDLQSLDTTTPPLPTRAAGLLKMRTTTPSPHGCSFGSACSRRPPTSSRTRWASCSSRPPRTRRCLARRYSRTRAVCYAPLAGRTITPSMT